MRAKVTKEKEPIYVDKKVGYYGRLVGNEYHEGKIVLVKNEMVILLEDTSIWWDEGKFGVIPLMPGESFTVTTF
jgi:hypothetical protein